MTKFKFNQRNYGKIEIKSNDPIEFKLKYLSHHKPQFDSNPNHKAKIKSIKPLQSPN